MCDAIPAEGQGRLPMEQCRAREGKGEIQQSRVRIRKQKFTVVWLRAAC